MSRPLLGGFFRESRMFGGPGCFTVAGRLGACQTVLLLQAVVLARGPAARGSSVRIHNAYRITPSLSGRCLFPVSIPGEPSFREPRMNG